MSKSKINSIGTYCIAKEELSRSLKSAGHSHDINWHDKFPESLAPVRSKQIADASPEFFSFLACPWAHIEGGAMSEFVPTGQQFRLSARGQLVALHTKEEEKEDWSLVAECTTVENTVPHMARQVKDRPIIVKTEDITPFLWFRRVVESGQPIGEFVFIKDQLRWKRRGAVDYMVSAFKSGPRKLRSTLHKTPGSKKVSLPTKSDLNSLLATKKRIEERKVNRIEELKRQKLLKIAETARHEEEQSALRLYVPLYCDLQMEKELEPGSMVCNIDNVSDALNQVIKDHYDKFSKWEIRDLFRKLPVMGWFEWSDEFFRHGLYIRDGKCKMVRQDEETGECHLLGNEETSLHLWALGMILLCDNFRKEMQTPNDVIESSKVLVAIPEKSELEALEINLNLPVYKQLKLVREKRRSDERVRFSVGMKRGLRRHVVRAHVRELRPLDGAARYTLVRSHWRGSDKRGYDIRPIEVVA